MATGRRDLRTTSNCSNPAEGRLKLVGELALPVGLTQLDVSPIAMVAIDLAGSTARIDHAVVFTAKGGDQERWEYRGSARPGEVERFRLDWISGVAKFTLEALFEPGIDPTALVRELSLDLALGLEGFPGAFALGPAELEVRRDEWKFRRRN